jgi:DNA (cytosine-5)-methyltransferase 1
VIRVKGSHISLFAGAAMTDLAAEAFGFHTVLTAEIDVWNRKLLTHRLPDAIHVDDVRKVSAGSLPGGVQRPLLMSGGFPCQDLSLAGKGAGLRGARSGLWREFLRLIHTFKPEYVLIENVAALRSRGLDAVLNDLHYAGYDARWDCIPAASVGAPHMRDRMFIAAVKRGMGLCYKTGDTAVGYVGPKGDGFHTAAGQPVLDLPRAGLLRLGTVYGSTPLATVSDVKKALKSGTMLLPSPAAHNPGWKFTPTDRDGNLPAHPNQRFYHPETGRVVQKGVEQIAKMYPDTPPASVRLLPTPTRSDGSGGPGTSPKRTGGKNLRTVIADLDGNGRINPVYVEWMMGLPLGWTDLSVPNHQLVDFPGWDQEPDDVSRTVAVQSPDRSKRIRALGNGLVPQAAAVALSWMLA